MRKYSIDCGLVLVLVVAVFSGCDSRTSGSGGTDGRSNSGDPDGASKHREAARRHAERREAASIEDRVRKDFASLRERVDSVPGTAARVKLADGFLARAGAIAVQHGISLPEIAAAETLRGGLQGDLEFEMESALAELEQTVMENLHSAAPDPLIADTAINQFPAGNYPGTNIKDRLAALKKTVSIYQLAEMDFIKRESFLETFGNDYAKMVGYLEGFDPDYEDTPYGGKIRVLVKEAYQHYVQMRGEEKAAAEVAVSKRWPLGDYRWEGHPDCPVSYDRKEKILSLGPNPADYEQKDRSGSYVMIGDGTWVDVRLSFEAQVKNATKIRFAAKAREDRGRHKVAAVLSLEKLDLAEGEWHKFVVVVQGGGFEVSCLSTDKTLARDHHDTDEAGDFMVQVLGDNASVRVRDLEYSVLRRVETAVVRDGDDGGDDGGK